MKFVSIITIAFAVLSVASASPLSKRRFGQEHTPRADADFQAMKDIAVGTGFDAQLGDLSGAAVRALLAKAPACDQQDVADQMIDIANQIKAQGKADSQTKSDQLIAVAKDYRTLERNTPGTGQASELCNRAPRNAQLNGLVQAQDPTGTTPTTSGDAPTTAPTTPPAGGAADPATVTVTTTVTVTVTAAGATAPTTPADPAAPADPATPTTTTSADPAAPTTPTTPADPATPPSTGSTDKSATTPGTIITLDNAAFTAPVAGISPPQIVVNQDGNPSVNGNRFLQLQNAIQRACDIQKNQCFNKFNGGDHTISQSDCENQQATCSTGNPIFS